MALYDSIVLEIQNGRLSSEFRAADLLADERMVFRDKASGEDPSFRVGFDFYAKGTIRSELANNAEGTGYTVLKGGAPKYQRVSEGLYRVLGLGEQEESLDWDDALEESSEAEQPCAPEESFATYLETQPFQIFDRRRKRFHPATPVTGVDARISAYFWPDPKTSFDTAETVLSGYVERAQALLVDLDGHAAEVRQLFSEICQWGRVPLPPEAPSAVVRNLQLAKAQVEGEEAKMNSAWTKLYAFFYPDEFVIYDSRVATAIISIVENALTDAEIDQFRTSYPALGFMEGMGGKRRGTRLNWKNAYSSWAAQLDANRLVKKVLTELNSRSGSSYSLRQLEAVLFMEGY